jgi:hypothetical protein
LALSGVGVSLINSVPEVCHFPTFATCLFDVMGAPEKGEPSEQLFLHGLTWVLSPICQELVYLSFHGIEFDLVSKASDIETELTIQTMQIDNQLHDTRFPVIFYPDVNFVMRNRSDHNPFLYGIFAKRKHPGKFSRFIRLISYDQWSVTLIVSI